MLIKYNFILTLLLAIPWILQAKILVNENGSGYRKLADCALFVTERYTCPFTNNLVVKEKCSGCTAGHRYFNERLLDYFLRNFKAMLTVQMFIGQTDDNPWNHHVFIVDNVIAFNELGFHISFNQYEREFYFLIILTHAPQSHHSRHQVMREIFLTCVVLRALHVVIMTSEQKHAESIAFYTYAFCGNHCGEDIEIVRVNRFQNGSLENDYLFPPQLTDFHGCTLNVTAYGFPPFIGFNGDQRNIEHTRDINRLTGIEGDHLKLLAKILNFKVKITFSKIRGIINLKENSTGCFADLETYKADIAVGCLSAAFENFTKFSTSMPYRYSPHFFVVRRDLHFGPIQQLAIPFHPLVWLTIGITICFALTFIKVISYCTNATLRAFFLGPNNHYPNTNLLTVLLGNPVVRPPRRNFARFLLMTWLLLTLILRSAYQGKLFDSLRVSRRAPIPNGITELVQQKYKMMSTAYTNFYPANLTVVNTDIENQYTMIQNADDSNKLTVVSTLERLGYFNLIYRNSSSLSFVPEQVFVQHLSLYFQRHSVLKITLDKKIQQLISSGITYHLTTKQYENKDFQLMNVGSQKLPRIGNEMLSGLYSIYMILIGITIVCFVCEIQTYRISKLRRFFNQLHYRTDH